MECNICVADKKFQFFIAGFENKIKPEIMVHLIKQQHQFSDSQVHTHSIHAYKKYNQIRMKHTHIVHILLQETTNKHT